MFDGFLQNGALEVEKVKISYNCLFVHSFTLMDLVFCTSAITSLYLSHVDWEILHFYHDMDLFRFPFSPLANFLGMGKVDLC